MQHFRIKRATKRILTIRTATKNVIFTSFASRHKRASCCGTSCSSRNNLNSSVSWEGPPISSAKCNHNLTNARISFFVLPIFHAKLRAKVRAELRDISRDISLEQRAMFPWTFVVSATNRVISLARTRNFNRHPTIVQSPSHKLLSVIDKFNFSCNLHEMYRCLYCSKLYHESKLILYK